MAETGARNPTFPAMPPHAPCAPCGPCGSPNGFPGATVCTPPQPQLYFFQGLQGQAGPLAVFCGNYAAGQIYYDNTQRVDIVAYGGFWWGANNSAKNGTNTWGTPNATGGDWVNIGLPAGVAGSNSYHASTNATGNTSITPGSSNHTEAIAVSGAASTRIFTLLSNNSLAGDKISLVFTLPATASLILQVTNLTTGGTQLLPTPRFASNQLVTNGAVLSFTAEFYFDGANWNYSLSNLPA